jgi:predicted glycosyltransferase
MKKRVLIYSQSLWGLGHLVRGIALANALIESFEVCLVTSWPKEMKFSIDKRFNPILLRPLRLDLSRKVSHPLEFDENISFLIPVDPEISVHEVIKQRQQRILRAILEFEPDIIITEYYPFGRWALGEELSQGMEHARKKGYSYCVLITRYSKTP